MANGMKANDVRDMVAGTLAKLMDEADPKAWVMPWFNGSGLPTNAKTGNQYHGGNVWSLLLGADVAGHSSQYWATYRQWADLGRQVSKGEKATYGVKWVFPTEEEKAKDPNKRAFPKAFAVHNFSQSEPLTDDGTAWTEPIKETGTAETIATAEAYVVATNAVVKLDANRAYYNPTDDAISLPALESFRSTEGYYGTLLHELTHWAGNARRLARDCARDYHNDKQARAREELVAELGAAMLCGTLGITQEPREDHAQYLKSWSALLANDSGAFWTAAALADKSSVYLDGMVAG